jgi:phage repressor protein C with HTH and peptisase S24 domain
MFTHDDIWRAIDRLAEDKGFSASGLARQAGLDPTAFNRSKRTSPNGKPRWPSTESLAKILSITSCTMEEFLQIMGQDAPAKTRKIPMLAYTTVRTGRIKAENTETYTIAINAGQHAFAMTVEDEKLRPLYRMGSVIVAELDAKISTDDRVLLFSKKDGLKGGILHSAQKRTISILLPEQDFREMTFPENEIEWIARILWASQ